jgi:cell division protein FtsL
MTTPVRARVTAAATLPARRSVEPMLPGHPGDAAPPRRLRVVPDGALSPRGKRRRARLLAAGVAVLVAAGLFGAVFFHVLLTQGQLQLDRIQTRAAAEQARNERLRLEVAELQSPERIVAAAQQQLGMVPPASVTYLSPSGSRPAGAPATTPAPGQSASPTAKSKATNTTKTTAKPATNATSPPSTVAIPSLSKPGTKPAVSHR